MNTLNRRQRLFVQEYCRHGCALEAARNAGYSPANARKQAWRLLQSGAIRDAIAQIREAHARRGEVAPEGIMEGLADIRDAALREGQLSVALRAEELRGRHIGLFQGGAKKKLPRLEEMTEDEILQTLGMSRKQAATLLEKCKNSAPKPDARPGGKDRRPRR